MKNIFKKKDNHRTEKQSKNRKIETVGTRKKTVLVLWIVLIGSFVFATYKNFTAIDQHTVHEKETIETQLIDTKRLKVSRKVL